MKTVIALTILITSLSNLSHSQAEVSADQVQVLSETQLDTTFKNIPLIQREFRGAQNRAEKEALVEKCQAWVAQSLNSLKAEKVFRHWCSVKKDVALREYRIMGNVLMRNW